MDTYCPECNAEIEDEILEAWHNKDEPLDFEFICPQCNQKTAVTVYSEPLYSFEIFIDKI